MYFDYNSTSPANAGIGESAQEAIPDTLTVDSFTDSDFSAYGLTYYGSALRLESKTSYIIYFAKDINYSEDMSLMCGTDSLDTVTVEGRSDLVGYEIKNIAPISF